MRNSINNKFGIWFILPAHIQALKLNSKIVFGRIKWQNVLPLLIRLRRGSSDPQNLCFTFVYKSAQRITFCCRNGSLGRRESRTVVQSVDVWGSHRDSALLSRGSRLQVLVALRGPPKTHRQKQDQGGGGLDGRVQVSILPQVSIPICRLL